MGPGEGETFRVSLGDISFVSNASGQSRMTEAPDCGANEAYTEVAEHQSSGRQSNARNA